MAPKTYQTALCEKTNNFFFIDQGVQVGMSERYSDANLKNVMNIRCKTYYADVKPANLKNRRNLFALGIQTTVPETRRKSVKTTTGRCD